MDRAGRRPGGECITPPRSQIVGRRRGMAMIGRLYAGRDRQKIEGCRTASLVGCPGDSRVSVSPTTGARAESDVRTALGRRRLGRSPQHVVLVSIAVGLAQPDAHLHTRRIKPCFRRPSPAAWRRLPTSSSPEPDSRTLRPKQEFPHPEPHPAEFLGIWLQNENGRTLRLQHSPALGDDLLHQRSQSFSVILPYSRFTSG